LAPKSKESKVPSILEPFLDNNIYGIRNLEKISIKVMIKKDLVSAALSSERIGNFPLKKRREKKMKKNKMEQKVFLSCKRYEYM
jgi:hypothetical protein